jgi:FG-GAP-like repeat/FG-GAP repeat
MQNDSRVKKYINPITVRLRRCLSIGVFTLLGAAGAHAATQESAAERLTKAADYIAAGELTKAIKILEVSQHDSDKTERLQAMRMLSRAYMRNKQPDLALPVLLHVLEVEPESPQEMYGIGVIYARKHETDKAFEWLGKAKASHRMDMTMMQTDATLDSLRSDPRYASLLPTPGDFANPFVENVKILREWDGESANDQFGWIARNVGDVDGDGAPDFVTSAPTKNIGGDDAGRVYVYSTRTGKLIWSVDGKPGDQLGSGLESAGDTAGSGVQDVVASAPGSDTAYVYSGKDGHTLLTFHSEGKGDNFGNHVASVGDIDHDGHADVIIGAPDNNAGGKGAGRAYIYSGKDGHVLLTLTGERAGDGFGSAVTGYSDGKFTFVVVGAPAAGPRKTGRVYVYDGLSAKPSFTFDADATGQKLGYMFLSIPGDVDGDGVPDVFASDWSNSAKGPSTGRVYVYSGKTGKPIHTFTGQTAGESFGTTESIAGDVDHDGFADLIVGSWQYSVNAISGGRAYLYSGKNGKLLQTYTCRTPGDTFGFDAVALTESKTDGPAKLLITSGWSAVHGFHSGRIFLISSAVEQK